VDLPIKLDAKTVGDKVTELGAHATCPYCGNTSWQVLEDAAIVRQWSNNIPSPGIPIALMICNKCGNIRMNSLDTLKLLPVAGG
jgi:uncharacterized Zn finger protein